MFAGKIGLCRYFGPGLGGGGGGGSSMRKVVRFGSTGVVLGAGGAFRGGSTPLSHPRDPVGGAGQRGARLTFGIGGGSFVRSFRSDQKP